MLLFTALRSRPLRTLWLGQVGSTLGDELYKMAYLWILSGVLGASTGWITSLQLMVGTLSALLGARWFDRMRPDLALIRLDLFRALLCLVPAIPFLISGRPSLPLLLFSTLALTALSAVFEPALQGLFPLIARSPRELKAGNNLMATTYRLSRVLAPFLISTLSRFVPMAAFFLIDALSFVFSAGSIRSLSRNQDLTSHTRHDTRITLKKGWLLLKQNPPVFRALLCKSIAAGLWFVGYTLGFVLLARESAQDGIGNYGALMACYGAGNLGSALVFGSFERKHSEGWLYFGISLIGGAFVLMGLSHSLFALCLFSAICATGGPLNDTPMLELIQEHYTMKDQLKVIRMRWFLENAFMLLASLLSPFAFQLLGTRSTLILCGIVILLAALGGLWAKIPFSRESSPT